MQDSQMNYVLQLLLQVTFRVSQWIFQPWNQDCSSMAAISCRVKTLSNQGRKMNSELLSALRPNISRIHQISRLFLPRFLHQGRGITQLRFISFTGRKAIEKIENSK